MIFPGDGKEITKEEYKKLLHDKRVVEARNTFIMSMRAVGIMIIVISLVMLSTFFYPWLIPYVRWGVFAWTILFIGLEMRIELSMIKKIREME